LSCTRIRIRHLDEIGHLTWIGDLGQRRVFFVARVNLGEQAKLGFTYLRPLQVAYESPKFMLPIRLGMVNADGPQELYVYALTRKGRVETTNPHRAVAVGNGPSPVRQLGVFWLADSGGFRQRGGARDVFLTRLHVRYDAAHFPEDLVFQETADRTNFQGRYVLRHPWTGTESCEAAARYRVELARRQEEEIRTLSQLTGWPIAEIRTKVPSLGDPVPAKSWWQKLWDK
jgi:hypothetical protein